MKPSNHPDYYRTSRIIIAAIFLIFFQTGVYAASSSGPLFHISKQKPSSVDFQPGSSLSVSVNHDLLTGGLTVGDYIDIPLANRETDRYRITGISQFKKGIISARAVHVDNPYHQMTFSYDEEEGFLLGKIDHFTDKESYRLLPLSENLRKSGGMESNGHLLKYHDVSTPDILECGIDEGITSHETLGKLHHHRHQNPEHVDHLHNFFDLDASSLSSDVPIDLMIVYTNKASEWANQNQGNIGVVIAEAMNLSQQALENSKVDIKLRLVHTHNVNYDESEGSAGLHLQRLTASPSFNPWGEGTAGFMNEVHTLRNTHGADLVAMFADISDVGGIAWILPGAFGFSEIGFSVNRVQQMSSSYTLIHEIGHNMGNHHSRNQRRSPAGVFGGMFDYSTGWRFTGGSGVSFATVMTYNEAPDQSVSGTAPVFSGPDVLFDDRQTGSYAGPNAPADNVRSMRYSRNLITNYRPTQKDPPLASVDNSTIEINAEFGEMQEISFTLGNNGNSPLYWTADISYPDPPAPAKIAAAAPSDATSSSGVTSLITKPFIPVTYPYLDKDGRRLIQQPGQPGYYTTTLSDHLRSINNSGYSDQRPAFLANETAELPDKTVYETDYSLAMILGESSTYQILSGWNAYPQSGDNRFTLTRNNPRSEPFHLRLSHVPGFESGQLVGTLAPFFGPLTSQGYSISMDLHFSELESENQFHIIVEDASSGQITAWLWFDDGEIYIRNQITSEGRDFFNSGASYEAGKYFNFEIRTDPVNDRILYFLDGRVIFNGNLFGSSAPESILLAHLNHDTEETFDIDNFSVTALSSRDFPRFQLRKESGGVAEGSSRQITFMAYADRPRNGVYEFDIDLFTNDASRSRVRIPVRYEVSNAPTSSEPEPLAAEYELRQNYPNPFNPGTNISYVIPEQSDVRLDVITINGQLVATLVNERQQAGVYSIPFHADGLASGVYLYRLQAGSFTRTGRMVLVR